jgi:hypothetical protein
VSEVVCSCLTCLLQAARERKAAWEAANPEYMRSVYKIEQEKRAEMRWLDRELEAVRAAYPDKVNDER